MARDYIWSRDLRLGAPNTLLGYPTVTDDNVEDIGADAYPIYSGTSNGLI